MIPPIKRTTQCFKHMPARWQKQHQTPHTCILCNGNQLPLSASTSDATANTPRISSSHQVSVTFSFHIPRTKTCSVLSRWKLVLSSRQCYALVLCVITKSHVSNHAKFYQLLTFRQCDKCHYPHFSNMHWSFYSFFEWCAQRFLVMHVSPYGRNDNSISYFEKCALCMNEMGLQTNRTQKFSIFLLMFLKIYTYSKEKSKPVRIHRV